MAVFFRTGENSAASISWPTYVFLVLPFQLLYRFAKMIVLAFKWLAVGIAALVTLAVSAIRSVRRHEEDRPPTP